MKRIRILGVGNPLMGDDGVGIAVVEALRREALPKGVEVMDAGTGGLDLVHLLSEVEAAVVVDAVEMGEEPGVLRWLTPEEVKGGEKPFHFSLHETRLGVVLRWLKWLGQPPPTLCLLGIQPAQVAEGIGLTPAVQQAIPKATEAIRKWLEEQSRRKPHGESAHH